jgi:GAF domain-containing protein
VAGPGDAACDAQARRKAGARIPRLRAGTLSTSYPQTPQSGILSPTSAETFNLRLLDLLKTTAEELVYKLDGQACAVSRTIGDVLIMIVDLAPPGRSLQLGGGFLVSDYPLTQDVLRTGKPRTLTLQDPNVDPQEASVLREIGLATLLMVPLELHGGPWGLVEVYRSEPRAFTEDDVRAAGSIISRAAALVG